MLFRRQPTEDQMRNYYPAIFADAPSQETSDKYLYIPTHKLINGLVKNGFSVVGARQSRPTTKSPEHAKHVVYLTPGEFSNLRDSTKVGEEIPLLALTNSHNARSSFKIDTSFYRLICSNGLMMPTNGHNSAKITHKVGMENDVLEASFKVVNEFPEQVRQINAMKSIELSYDEKYLLAESAKNLVFDEKVIETNKKHNYNIEQRLLTVRHWQDRGKNDLWTTFNAVQENAIKGGIRLMTEDAQGYRSLRKTRPVQAIDRNSKLNKELMALAMRFADLKAGVKYA